MQFNVASALGSLALTASIYGAGPLLLRLRKGPISSKALKWLHIGYTAILAFAFSVYDFSNGYDISFSPAILWGSIFYWWNRSYFEKYNYPPVQPATPAQAAPASPDPVPSEPELPAVIPEKPVKKAAPRALVIGLVVSLALSLAGNVWQGISWANNSAESAEKIRVLNNKLTQKEEAIKEYRTKVGDLNTELARVKAQKAGLYDHLDAALFLYNNIGFIVSGSSYYHNYECPVFQAASEYWAHNIEYCQSIGYGACPVCWD